MALLEEFAVTHGASVLQEQRSLGPRADDFQTVFPAARIDPATFLPVRALASFVADGRPIVWFTPDRRTAVVDARVFSELRCVDPLRMSPGESAVVGRRLGPAPAGRELAKLLIHAGIVRVYWHVEAQVRIETERDDATGFRTVVAGEHTYFTNKRHREPFRFELACAPDGMIGVSAMEPGPR